MPPETHEVPGVAEARRFVAPGGLTIDLVRAMAADEPARYASPAPIPRKFGHATLTSDVARRARGGASPGRWASASPTPSQASCPGTRCSADHHGVAIAPAPVSGLHHYAFELDGWASMQAFADHLTLNDVLLIWGPGRHGPGRNLFAYHLDPAGGVVEVLADLQRIESEETYVPGTWPMTPQTLNQWGPPPARGLPRARHAVPAFGARRLSPSRPVGPGASASSSPLGEASTTAWTRSRRSSFCRTWVTWVLTVPSPMKSSRPISALESPSATRRNTSLLARGQLVEPRGRRRRRRARELRITRLVTAGDSSASPAATVRIAAISCSGGSSLSTKPLAPAPSAS